MRAALGLYLWSACVMAADLPKTLRLDLQRHIDPRLVKIEAGEFGGGEVHVVRAAVEVRALSGKLKPGDQLVLAGAAWKDARFTFEGRGTAEAPIVIRPEKPGSVSFTGESAVTFHGEHLIVHDLAFVGVTVSKNNEVLFRVGNGEAKPANHCIFNRLLFENCGSTNPADWPNLKLWLMSMRGRGNTVSNSTFRGFKHIGQMIGAAELPKDGLQQLHVLNNRFIDRPKIDDQNGYEILQIGWSGEKAAASGTLIAGNVFEDCDGENEIVSLKASDVVVRDNQFLGCQGVLSLRSANRVLVQGNVFDGKGQENAGGITLEGADHVLIDNTLRRLVKQRNYYFWTIAMAAGSAENYGDNGDVAGYGRPKNILITQNRFEHCDSRIAAGTYLRKEFPLVPKNIRVEQNAFIGTKAKTAFDFIADDSSGDLPKELLEAGNTFEP
jgi:poly(beta-D-mannuronate) lyase